MADDDDTTRSPAPPCAAAAATATSGDDHDAEVEHPTPPAAVDTTEKSSTTAAVGVRDLLLASSWLEKLAMTVGTVAAAVAGWFLVSLEIVAVDKLLLTARGTATQRSDVSRVFHREMELLALFGTGCLLRYLSWSWAATSFTKRHKTTSTSIQQWGLKVQYGVAAMRTFGVAVENGWDLMVVMAVTVVVPLAYMALKNRWNSASLSQVEVKKKRLAAHVEHALRHRDVLRANASIHASVVSVARRLDHEHLANEGVGMTVRMRIVTSMVLFSTPLLAALWYAVSYSASNDATSSCETEGAPVSVCGTGRRLTLVCVSVVLLFSSASIAMKSTEEEDDQQASKSDVKGEERDDDVLARKDEIVTWLRAQLQPETHRRRMHRSLSIVVATAAVFTSVLAFAHVVKWILTLTAEDVSPSEIWTRIALTVGGLALAGVALSCSMFDTTVTTTISRLRLTAIDAALASSSTPSDSNAAAPLFGSINEDAARVAYQSRALVPAVPSSYVVMLTLAVGALVIASIDMKIAGLRVLLMAVERITLVRHFVRMDDPVAVAVDPLKPSQWETMLMTYVVPMAKAMLFVVESHWILSGAASPLAPLVATLVSASLPATLSFSIVQLGDRSSATGLLAACWRLQQLTDHVQRRPQATETSAGLRPAFTRGDVEIVMPDNLLNIQGGECVAIHGGDNMELVARAFVGGNAGDANVSVSIDGHDVTEYAQAWRERRVWLLDSAEPLLLASSWLDNVSLGLQDVSEEEIVKAATDAGLAKYVRLQDDVSTEVLDGSAALSPAILRSLTVARALLRNPDLLVMTAHHDTATTEPETPSRLQDIKIVSALKELLPQRTLLVLTTTASLEPWKEVVDRTLAA